MQHLPDQFAGRIAEQCRSRVIEESAPPVASQSADTVDGGFKQLQKKFATGQDGWGGAGFGLGLHIRSTPVCHSATFVGRSSRHRRFDQRRMRSVQRISSRTLRWRPAARSKRSKRGCVLTRASAFQVYLVSYLLQAIWEFLKQLYNPDTINDAQSHRVLHRASTVGYVDMTCR